MRAIDLVITWKVRDAYMKKEKKKYLIALEERHSIVALVAGILVFICTLASVIYMAEDYLRTNVQPLYFFTVWSNLLSAVAAAFMIPYAVEGIWKKRFLLPRWVVLFQYTGATCVAITMVSALVIILPTQGFVALEGANFWLHIITPAFTVVLFHCVETGITFRFRESLLTMIPYWIYMAVYFVMAIILGEERGGWPDFYMTTAFWPAWVSMLLMLAVGFVVSLALLFVQNKQAAQSRKKIARAWSEDLEPTQLLIEAFGLGRYIGAHGAYNELTVPLDIFMLMEKQYGVPVDKLVKAYVKGALDAIEERTEK